VPVLILTVRDAVTDRITGLDLGADDYLTKPFSHLELFARIKAVLRRTESIAPVSALPSFVSGDLAVNFDSREVTVADKVIKLTPTEYNLLYLLVRNAGRVLPFETLLAKVWGDEYRSETDYLKTYVSRLRRKLGDHPEQPRYIITERGAGYRFARPTTVAASRVRAS
jgi:two-component system KDP operon response regulator KdpE